MTAARFESEVFPHLPKLRQRASQFVRGAGDAEDLVQETLLRAWRSWGRAEIRDVWSWLWLIMRNVFLDGCWDSKRWAGVLEAHTPEIADARSEPPPAPDARVISGADDDLLARVRQLRGTQRAVIELHLVGLDDEAVACRLQMNLKTVRSAACKARQRLRATI